MRGTRGRAVLSLLALSVLMVPLFYRLAPLSAQGFDKMQRDRVRQMLRDLADAMRKHYYDPDFHHIDMEARFAAADRSIQEAPHLGDTFLAIAAATEPLNDSHTFFLPPSRPIRLDYGFEKEMVGDRCFVTAVRPGSDAATKLKPGDEILAIGRYKPQRDSLWKLNYFFERLAPQPMPLVLITPGGERRNVTVVPRTRDLPRVTDLTFRNGGSDAWQFLRDQESAAHLLRQRTEQFGDTLLIWKMPMFNISAEEVGRLIHQARKHDALVLDLRGNPGGAVDCLQSVVAGLIDHDVTIAERRSRKELKPLKVKSWGKRAYAGKLIVLIDSRSASAAELLSRTVQLEHRGTILGDRSSGSVMEARYYPFSVGTDTVIFFGAMITDADLIMGDGRSLEHVGVTPDQAVVPSAADLAADRDPVLSRAADFAGVKLTPEEAGKLFPIEWQPD